MERYHYILLKEKHYIELKFLENQKIKYMSVIYHIMKNSIYLEQEKRCSTKW